MRRPIRSTLEAVTDRVPNGPLGFVGGGNAVGAVNYFSVALINGIIPVDGLEVGYNIESSSIEQTSEGKLFTYTINAYNKDVTRFLAKFRSAPSNINFLSQRTEIEGVGLVEKRRAASTWRVRVLVEDRDITKRVNGDM